MSRNACLRQSQAAESRDGEQMDINSNQNYHDQQNIENINKMRDVLETLPKFCKQFFRGIANSTSARTRLAYAYDVRLFFEFLHEKNSYCAKMEIRDYPLSLLDRLSREDIEEYSDYLSYYQKDGKVYTNDERGKKRKLASLRSFYNYYFKEELIEKNPAQLVPLPKLHDKEIVRLDADEVAVLLDQVEDGTGLTKTQQRFHNVTKTRDIALLTLLLGTGIRVSECGWIWMMWIFAIMVSGFAEKAVMRRLYILAMRWRKLCRLTWNSGIIRFRSRDMRKHSFYLCRTGEFL